MDEEQNKALIRDFLIELDNGLDAIDHFFSPHCVAHLPGTEDPTDREGFKAFVSMLYTAFPDLRHTIFDQVAEHEKVANLVVARGKHWGVFQNIAPTGKAVVITDIMIVRIMDGRVMELWAQFDALGLLRQLGITL
jgi:predicted ester cyclase